LTVVLIVSCSASSSKDNGSSDEKKAETHYQLGLSALNRGDMIGAKREISIAISLDDESPYYHNYLGIVFLKDKEYKNAENEFRKALEIDKNYTDPYNNLGVLYLEQRELVRAREMFVRVLSDPIYPFPHYAETNLGVIARLEKNYAEAEKRFIKSLKLDGKFCTAYKELGVLYEEQGDLNKSTESFVKAADLCPAYVEVLYRAALKLISSKQEAKGKGYLAKCIDIDSNNINSFDIPFLRECLKLAADYDVKAENSDQKSKKEVEGTY